MQNRIKTREKMRKRGISPVIATTLITFISIAALLIFYLAVRSTTEGTMLSPQLSCADMRTSRIISIESACFDSQNKEIVVKVKRAFEQTPISSIEFATSTGKGSEKWQCGSGCTNCIVLNEGETKIYRLNSEIPQQGSSIPPSISISVDNCALESIEIKENCQ